MGSRKSRYAATRDSTIAPTLKRGLRGFLCEDSTGGVTLSAEVLGGSGSAATYRAMGAEGAPIIDYIKHN